jgi:hypothetical protein
MGQPNDTCVRGPVLRCPSRLAPSRCRGGRRRVRLPALALGLITAAVLVPGAKVSESNQTIAGQKSLCATASNLDAAASPADEEAPRDVTVCVTEGGVLASFAGHDSSGRKLGMVMTTYSSKAEAASFQPPPGAKIVSVDQIETPPSN